MIDCEYIYYGKPFSNVSILYRVDNPTNSQIWLLEGGRKVMLGQYDLINLPVNQATIATHVAGVRNLSAAEYQFLITFGARDDQRNIFGYFLNLSAFINAADNNPEQQEFYSDQALSESISTSFSSSSLSTNFAAQVAGFQANSDHSHTGGGASTFAIYLGSYYLPRGTYDFNARYITNRTYTGPEQNGFLSRTGSNIFTGPITYVGSSPSGGTGISTIAGFNDDIDELFSANPVTTSTSWIRNYTPILGLRISSGVQKSTSTAGDMSSTSSASIEPQLNNFRPIAYLAKTQNARYVALQYLDSNSVFTVDYYEISNALTFTKTSWAKDVEPAPSVDDMQRSLITYSYDDFIFDSSNLYWTYIHNPFFPGYRPQFYFRTTDVTGPVQLPEGTQMVMPGDNTEMTVELIAPIAMDEGLRFAIREGGRTVGAGRVVKITK